VIHHIPEVVGFDWDEGNRDKNLSNHHVSNGECEQIFFNEPLIILDDPKHSQVEPRYAAFGKTDEDRRLVTIFTMRGERLRIISARDMNRKEKAFYEKGSEEIAGLQN
jgi:uncharacterized DUF497 family protein